MTLPTFNRSYAHWRSLRQLVDIVVDKYEYATDEVIDVHFGGHPDDFEKYLAGSTNGMDALTREMLSELLDLIVNTSMNHFVLSFEDRDFLARVRSHLCDGLTACLEGDIEAVANSVNEAYKGLDFITYKRKRTDRRDFHNPFAVERPKFEKLTARTSRLARAFDRVVVST